MYPCLADGSLLLTENAVQIALDYLDRSGEMDDYTETCQFLVEKVEFMIRQGQRSKLMLANRAIAAYQRYRRARTVELSLIAG
jgi:hypothetical protein